MEKKVTTQKKIFMMNETAINIMRSGDQYCCRKCI